MESQPDFPEVGSILDSALIMSIRELVRNARLTGN